MPYYKIVAACCIALLTSFYTPGQTGPRAKYNFNTDWKVNTGDIKGADSFSFNDADWKKVTLPYAWNEDEAFKKDIAELSTGIAWYRKHFKLPAAAKGQKVFLE